MKKPFKLLVLSIIATIISFFMIQHFVESKTNITVYIKNNYVKYDEKPLLKNGRTMVPIRKTMEALGSSIVWDQKEQKITIKKDQNIVVLRNGSNDAFQNGVKMEIDAPPFIKNGRSYIPLRFISEAFQHTVHWDNHSKKITINPPKKYASQQVKIPIIMYHHIEKNTATGAVISPERFREHMIAIKNNGYQTITDYELLNFLENKNPLPNKPILITFDDGYKSNITYAYPVLKELEMKATINLITSKVVDGKNLFPNEIPKLSWEDARKTSDVFSFQGHTHNLHYKGKDEKDRAKAALANQLRLPDGKVETQEQFENRVYRDLQVSKNMIEEKLQQEVITLAYPYGVHSNDTIRLAKKAGYKMAFTVTPGLTLIGENNHLFKLPRINGHGKYSGQQLIDEINKH